MCVCVCGEVVYVCGELVFFLGELVFFLGEVAPIDSAVIAATTSQNFDHADFQGFDC